ncbi:hypothetical protein AGABI2DRAFT_120057 [Agaricus bisporus var. bisporus H97]|uniref:hypothetical protein n=1 Tax=Agaricus bisporus var. bisporus (strain H97 / ATCC MYA-4626 / FGSC 10389) TaxID=936046 RepID=UPI00029F50B2|nr:hypothetical protein AGABI2DRAFT_120057 [Agaricus bisporus var. bisporus H97]EKV45087.1 hypothetical protein AGABI2DRAFT_120057 [Agaricus bisporus var. bisporus H97]
MSSKCNFQLSPVHPPIGTFIDEGSLQLVEVLGIGGYGVVYRAVEARPTSMAPKSYAVKCLVAPPVQNPRSRQVHIREITLHQLASRHPGVVTLHRVVECLNLTYIIMDYAPDHDLFTQILHSCRYLGDDSLIKHVFLQLLDAVEYCHSLGIYHRDLKPENILCYDDGLRIAITDFGLATTEKMSDEFRTGSVFHMSPECQGSGFGHQGSYSPMHNDIWSLGIILLNLATGRNPWKSATADDPTFQAYLRGPNTFLPSVLPISSEVNKILVGMLDIDYRRRTPLRDVRRAIRDVTSFYSEGVIFEGSMARCPWESGMDIDSDSSEESDPLPRSPSPVPEAAVSRWSTDTTSDIVFAHPGKKPCIQESTFDYTNGSSCGATWAYESTISSSASSTSSSKSEPGLENSDMFDGSRTPSEASIQSPVSSFPATPNNGEIAFGSKTALLHRKPLTINTNIPQPRFYDRDASVNSFSEDSAIMQTANEYDPYSSMYYLTSAISESKAIALPASAVTATAVAEDKEMTSPSTWLASQDVSSPSTYSRSSSRTSSSPSIISPRPVLPRHFRTGVLSPSVFLRSNSPSPEPNWLQLRARQVPAVTHNYSPEQSQHLSPVYNTIAMTDALSPLSPLSPSRQPHMFFPQPPTHIPTSHQHNKPQFIDEGASGTGTAATKSKPNGIFGLKFFPRTPSPTRLQTRATHERARSPTAKITPINDTLTDSSIAGAENATESSSRFTLGGFTFEPPRQAFSSPHPEASNKSSRSLVTRNKKIAQTVDAEETEGEVSGSARRKTKQRRDSNWFGTRDGGRRLWDREAESYGSQDVPFGTPTTLSGIDDATQKVPHHENSPSSPSSGRQSRFSVGRRNRREQRSRMQRHWFMPGRFFASAGAAT